MVTIPAFLYEIQLKNRYRKVHNGSNQWLKVYVNSLNEGLPTAPCLDTDLTESSEGPATDLFGHTVARKKLQDSGQNCAGDIFLLGSVKAEFACYSQEKTHCLWKTFGGREGYVYTRKAARERCWLPAFNAIHGDRCFRSARVLHRQRRPGTVYPLGCGHPV